MPLYFCKIVPPNGNIISGGTVNTLLYNITILKYIIRLDLLTLSMKAMKEKCIPLLLIWIYWWPTWSLVHTIIILLTHRPSPLWNHTCRIQHATVQSACLFSLFNQACVFSEIYHLRDSYLRHLKHCKTSQGNHAICLALISHCLTWCAYCTVWHLSIPITPLPTGEGEDGRERNEIERLKEWTRQREVVERE